MEQSIKDILTTIDDAINTFQEKIPGIQKLMFDELQPLLKELKLKNGKLLNNVENLKLLGSIKNKLEKIIISPEYKDAVKKFVESYNTLSSLNMTYFAQFNNKFTPSKTLPFIKQLAIESTITDLVGQGMSETIVGGVRNILNTNITTGGSYASLQEQLRNHIINNESGEGTLVKYTKQITTDAVNQFHSQYHAAIAQDLQFNWGRYVGSLLKTSRQFCILLTAKEWVHKTELPEIIEGHIDGEELKLSKTTGLPLGMIPGTDANNFKIRRGGYQCGHHYFEVPESAVPENVKKEFPVTTIIKNAQESASEVDSLGKDIAKKYDGDATPVNFKSRQSILRKVNGELGGDFSQLKDGVRNTVVVPYKDLNQVVSDLKFNPKFIRVKVQEGDSYYGYKGVITNIKTSNGLVAEMQVNSAGMIYAKEPKNIALSYIDERTYNSISQRTGLEGGLGHKYYEQIREINPATATPEQLLSRENLIKESKKYYSNFYGF